MLALHLCAIGKMSARAAERLLVEDYAARFKKHGRALGFSGPHLHEIEPRKAADQTEEAVLLRKSVPEGALICALDERGTVLNSPAFATQLARWRDGGQRSVAFMIGGADGLDPSLRRDATFHLSFGAMVWPHLLARVMLCEQLYRAASILAGTPYHRA